MISIGEDNIKITDTSREAKNLLKVITDKLSENSKNIDKTIENIVKSVQKKIETLKMKEEEEIKEEEEEKENKNVAMNKELEPYITKFKNAKNEYRRQQQEMRKLKQDKWEQKRRDYTTKLQELYEKYNKVIDGKDKNNNDETINVENQNQFIKETKGFINEIDGISKSVDEEYKELLKEEEKEKATQINTLLKEEEKEKQINPLLKKEAYEKQPMEKDLLGDLNKLKGLISGTQNNEIKDNNNGTDNTTQIVKILLTQQDNLIEKYNLLSSVDVQIAKLTTQSTKLGEQILSLTQQQQNDIKILNLLQQTQEFSEKKVKEQASSKGEENESKIQNTNKDGLYYKILSTQYKTIEKTIQT